MSSFQRKISTATVSLSEDGKSATSTSSKSQLATPNDDSVVGSSSRGSNELVLTSQHSQNSSSRLLQSSGSSSHHLMPLNLSHVTDQLLGRQDEQTQLLQAIQRCVSQSQRHLDADAHTEKTLSLFSPMVVIHGESGSGKSALVQKTLEGYDNSHADADDNDNPQSSFFFVQGKFNQFESRNHGALTNAVTELCHLIQQEQNQQDENNASLFVETLCQRLVEAMGAQELAVLVRLLPILQTVVRLPTAMNDAEQKNPDANAKDATFAGETTSVAKETSLQRFVLLLRTFFNVVSQLHPVVLWLDDLQWADETCLRLVESVAAHDTSTKGLLLICSMRDNEDDQEGSFGMVQTMLQSATVPVPYISVRPFSAETINDIVAAATENERDKAKTLELATLVHRKTRGNVYHCLQYLEMLHRSELLVFDMVQYKWEWNVEAIDARTSVSENVVQLLTRKISALPTDAQVVLMVAACLGFSFDYDTLQVVASSCLDTTTVSTPEDAPSSSSSALSTEARVIKAYQKACQSGLVEEPQPFPSSVPPMSSTKVCKFSHDRVRQSAMELIPNDAQGAKFRHEVGTVLLKRFQLSNENTTGSQPTTTSLKQEWMLFSALELLTSDSALRLAANDIQEDRELSRLCMLAAQRAAQRSAFVSQARFADKGISLLSSLLAKRMWEEDYGMCLELYILSSHGHYSFGSFENSIKSIDVILEQGRSLDDVFPAQMIRLAIYGAAADMANGTKACTKTLLLLGVHIRKPSQFNISYEGYKVKRLLKGRQATDLFDLPTLKEPNAIKALQVLDLGVIYAWRAGDSPTLLIYILKSMELTLRHGLGVHGPISLALYGAYLGILGDYDGGYEYGRVGEEMCFLPGRTKDGVPATIKVNHLFSYHLKKPVFESLDKALQAYHIARENGDVMLAAYCLQMHGMLGVVVGMSLDSLEKEISGYCSFCREFRQGSCLMELLPYHQLALNLLGRSKDPLLLTGMAMVEPDFVVCCRNSSEMATSLLLLVYAKTLLYYLLDELDLADGERRKVSPKQDFAPSYIMMPLNYFFCSMTCLGLARRSKSRKYKRQAEIHFSDCQPGQIRFTQLRSHACTPNGRKAVSRRSQWRYKQGI